MHNQMILLRKTFAALLTHKRSLASMKLAVRHQMALQRKRATTLLTNKRTISTVHSRMR